MTTKRFTWWFGCITAVALVWIAVTRLPGVFL